MVPKIHAKGKSFKGAATYLLHDKDRAETSDRVAWVETLNLATNNPHSAWKVMAATAMKQEELKETAGVKKTGRKSPDAVLHLSLSWHPEEKDGLTREEMVRSALGALKALGADSRQALIVSHNDERQPHVHILVNRVSQDDGRMLSSSKEKLNLSKWAEKYEKDRGQIYCEDRVLNNDARNRKKFTRGKKDVARNIYETTPANDNRPKAEQIRAEQRQKDAGVAKQARETRERQRRQWAELRTKYKQNVKDIKAQATKEISTRRDAIREQMRPEFQMLFHERQARLAEFINKEKSVLGRVSNALKAIDFKAILRGQDTGADGLTRRSALEEAFNALSSSGARKVAIERKYVQEKRVLELKENRAEREAMREIRSKRDERLDSAREGFEKDRNDLVLTQRLEGAKVRTDWKTRNEQRSAAWEKATSLPGGRALDRDQVLAEKLRLIEAFRERMKDRSKDHDRDRDN